MRSVTNSLELSISEEKSYKMVKIVVETFGEDALRKLFCDLSQKEDSDKECSLCSMPTLLHCDTSGKRI